MSLVDFEQLDHYLWTEREIDGRRRRRRRTRRKRKRKRKKKKKKKKEKERGGEEEEEEKKKKTMKKVPPGLLTVLHTTVPLRSLPESIIRLFLRILEYTR